MTARPESEDGAALPAAPLAGPGALADGLLRALPEPALLLTRSGAIQAANPAAAALLGASTATLPGARLAELVSDPPEEVGRFLDACARTRSPVPGALRSRVTGAGAPTRHGVSGAVVRPASSSGPALVLLRFRAVDGTGDRFALLNRQLDELTREVRARRATEAALRDANARLQDQAVEVELANQQLQEQALELEQQMEEVRVFAEQLEQANDGLAAAAAAADAARALAEQANRAKSDFLAVMSHELRTPLNAIGGYAELIELGIHGPVTEAQRTALARIQASQRHLLALINEVLNFARLEAGEVRFHLTAVPVDALLRGLDTLITPQVRAQQLRYENQGAAPSVVALADPEKLQQVLLNLLSNAVKFTPAGGLVTMSGRLVGEAAGARVEIRVRDTGIGIAADRQAHVFEPFVQLDQSLTRPHEGVGLGLAISRDLVHGMGGDLTADSVPGEGSTFTVSLPAATRRAASLPAKG